MKTSTVVLKPPGSMCVCREDLVRPAVAVDIDRWSPGLRPPPFPHNLKSPAQLTTHIFI